MGGCLVVWVPVSVGRGCRARVRAGHVRAYAGMRVSCRLSRARTSRRMSASGGGCANDVTRDVGLVTRRVVTSSVGLAHAAGMSAVVSG